MSFFLRINAFQNIVAFFIKPVQILYKNVRTVYVEYYPGIIGPNLIRQNTDSKKWNGNIDSKMAEETD